MADSTLSKTARASTRGKITKKAWHVSRESGAEVNRIKLVNHMISGKRTTRMGWITDDGQVLLDNQVEYRTHLD